MKYFTNNPLERQMMRPPTYRPKPDPAPPVPKSHPCYGCGNYGRPCVGFCHRELEKQLRERRDRE